MKILNINARTVFGLKDAVLVAVLTEDRAKQLAVYWGVIPDDRYRQEKYHHEIAAGGNKLSYKEATCHFPALPESRYRT